jgi:hypothetical protein
MTNPTATASETAVSHVYFLAFQYQGNGDVGFANTELALPAPIRAFADVQAIERYLRNQGYPNALVMGFNLLRTEAVQAGGAR